MNHALFEKIDEKYGSRTPHEYIALVQKEQELEQRERAIDLQQEILEAICAIANK